MGMIKGDISDSSSETRLVAGREGHAQSGIQA